MEEAGTQLRELGGKVFAAAADVTQPDQVNTFITASAEALGGIDVLVNNAGRAHPGMFETLTDADWQADLEVKLFSMIRCSRVALPYMRQRGGGRIINISAIQARSPDPRFFATSTNRAACLAFTKTLALEVAHHNVLVNAINVGFVATPQWKNIHQLRAPELSENDFFKQIAGADVPLRRFGRPEEVAGIVVFLAGNRASYITGASIDVSGGMGRFL